MNDYDLTPIEPADVQIGMRIRVTIDLPAVGCWLPVKRVAEGTVTGFPGDTRKTVYLDGEHAVSLYPGTPSDSGEALPVIKVERAPYQLRTVVLGHQPDEDIDAVWVKRPYGWYEVSNFDSADEVIVTKVLWAPPAVSE